MGGSRKRPKAAGREDRGQEWAGATGLRGGASSGSPLNRRKPDGQRSFRLDGKALEVYRMEDRDSEEGEASRPAGEQGLPGGARALGIVSINVASWHRHGAAAMEAAEQCGATILCVQETNISEEAVPGGAAAASRNGWSMTMVPQPRLRKGGVAVLLRDPRFGFHLTSEQPEWGQLIAVEVLGADRPLTVVSCYRHKLPGLASAAAVMTLLRSRKDKTWVVAMDWNEEASTKGQ